MTVDEAGQRCAVLRREAAQPLAGSAPQSDGWLLVTDPGPWSSQPFTAHRTDPEQGAAIADRAAALRLRPLLIRRHGRQATQRRFAVVDSLTGRVGWQSFEQFADVAAAAWEPAQPMAEPVYLVCTHGARDACCAIDGRPVAAALNALRPQCTWESSHVGGHRYAANVVVLPYGLVYGAVTADDVEELVAATEAGQLVPRLLRGRCTEPPDVQAARVAAASASGLLGIDELRLKAVHGPAGSGHVEFDSASGLITVSVQARDDDVMASCGKPAGLERSWVAKL